MSEKVSVVMSTYNELEKSLRDSIESIINQTYSNIEFIIVLDNPQNAMIEQVVNEYAQSDPRIIVVKNERNLGAGLGRNEGIKRVTGKYIACMDAGDISYPDRIQNQLSYYTQHDLDIIGGFSRYLSEEDGTIIGEDTIKEYTGEDCLKMLKYFNPYTWPTCFTSTEVFRTLGGYRNIFTEDDDILLRAHQAGYSIGYCRSVVLDYILSSGGISRNNELRQRLTSVYFRKNLKRLNQITQAELDLKIKPTFKDEQRYQHAKRKLYIAIGAYKNLPKFIYFMLSAICICPYILIEFRNFIVRRMISRRALARTKKGRTVQ